MHFHRCLKFTFQVVFIDYTAVKMELQGLTVYASEGFIYFCVNMFYDKNWEKFDVFVWDT